MPATQNHENDAATSFRLAFVLIASLTGTLLFTVYKPVWLKTPSALNLFTDG